MPSPSEGEMKYVLDGGSPLQRDAKFDSVKRKYKSPIIVFDGFGTGPSTKDMTHLRRSGGTTGFRVNFVGVMSIKMKKDRFLANSTNKQRFIIMLSEKLQGSECKTVHAESDADLLIVQTVVESASTCATTVIGQDMDLLILLCFHADSTYFDLLLRSEKKQSNETQKICNIHWLQSALGPETCNLLPFVQALCGCDTPSCLFGIGKGAALKKLKSNTHFKKQAEVFCRVAFLNPEEWGWVLVHGRLEP